MIGAMRRGLPIAAICLLAAPSAAAAAVRHASPSGGAVPGCPLATPCSLQYAITAAEPNDEVLLSSDRFDVGAKIVATVPLTIAGLARLPLGVRGEPPPGARIVGAPGVTPLESEFRQTVQNLTIEATEPERAALVAYGDGSVFDHLVLRATGSNASALRPGNEFRLTDSLLVGAGAGSEGLFLQGTDPGTPELRNDTIVASGPESTALELFVTKPGASVTMRATNVIADAATDVDAGATPGANGSVVLDHSDWDTMKGAVTGTATQTAPPIFSDAEYHEASTSPTVDTGVNDPANGTTDLDGEPRTANGRLTCAPAPPPTTDIGAYELNGPVPPCAAQPPPLDTRITEMRIDRRRSLARFGFRALGAATGFQCMLTRPRSRAPKKRPRFSKCASPRAYRHLRPGRYVFSVRAVDGRRADRTPASRKFRITASAR
jgi:hypothetical protein